MGVAGSKQRNKQYQRVMICPLTFTQLLCSGSASAADKENGGSNVSSPSAQKRRRIETEMQHLNALDDKTRSGSKSASKGKTPAKSPRSVAEEESKAAAPAPEWH